MSELVLEGVHTAVVTPFRSDALDLAAFRRHCERQIDAGVQGLVPCGTTGETPTLTTDEWSTCIQTAVAASDGRVAVTAGCGTNNTATTVANIRMAKALGADAALVVLPYYSKPPIEGLVAHIQAACAEGLPVVVYHVPGRTGQHIAPDQLAALCNVPGVLAIKEATGNMIQAGLLRLSSPVPMLSGDDFTLLPLLSLGGAGAISVLSNVVPAATVRLVRWAQAGAAQRATELHYDLLPIVRWLFHTANPVPCKEMMAAMGWCTNEVRLPLTATSAPVPPALLERVRRLST
jgi:4-hydroxy-tetrahydrodipicolinate synthase